MVFKIDTLFCELTNRCNANCIMCSHQFMKRKEIDMSIYTVEDILKQVTPKKIIYHLFGEPLLYSTLDQAFVLARREKIYSVIDTNAQLLTPEYFKYLSECGLNEVIISYGAKTKEVYESIWRNLDFDIVTNNIKGIWNIKKKYNLKTNIHIRIIITKENEHEMKNRSIEHMGMCYDQISFVNEFHLFRYYDRVLYRKRDVPDCLERDRLNKEMVIKCNGDIVLCCADLDGDYIMGNIHKDTIRNIYRGKIFSNFRDRIYKNKDLPDICVECGVRP